VALFFNGRPRQSLLAFLRSKRALEGGKKGKFRLTRFPPLIRNQPIEVVDNNELDLALLGFEVQTELLPERGKD